MLDFVARNWIWIVLIGAMFAMHVRHGAGGTGGHGTGGGCGAGHGGHQHNHRDQQSHERQRQGHHGASAETAGRQPTPDRDQASSKPGQVIVADDLSWANPRGPA
jgi:hypothetical protein